MWATTIMPLILFSCAMAAVEEAPSVLFSSERVSKTNDFFFQRRLDKNFGSFTLWAHVFAYLVHRELHSYRSTCMLFEFAVIKTPREVKREEQSLTGGDRCCLINSGNYLCAVTSFH